MDEFKRHLEYGKQARGEGIRFDRVSNSGNRVEDALRRGEPLRYTTQTSTPQVIKKVEKPPLSEQVKSSKPRRKINFRKILIPILGLILLCGVGYGVYYAYGHFRGEKTDNTSVLKEVGKQVGLPQDETPTIATVTNLEPLKGQDFFKDAEVGDKVLIFSKSKKAILYRPATKKIISIAPING